MAALASVLGLLVIGPSAPGGALIAKPALPPGAARGIVANRVMTWNLCNPCGGREYNAGRAADIATYAPQVVGLQEACVRDVEQIRDHLELLYGLVYHVAYGSVLHNWGRCGGFPWSPGGFGQAILSAAPMTDRRLVEYPDGGSEDRGYLAVTTTVGHRPVRVVDTHLAQRRQESVRAGQAEVLAREVARHERIIVLGDFNATPQAPELAPLWKVAADADPACGPTPGEGCATTTDWHSKFDYVFLRGIAPLAQGVHPSRYSDHHPVHADLGPVGGPRGTTHD
ncbi:endonuclease/exonuclease/phosphatase family protein [Streptomyces sp. SID5785]|uniref:endonuclease/exonuclease/phosphatase family protein n=1 Tax=Streptomyces sp. SID5785 TaxID=2690309 RepID=UPI0031BAC8AC